MIGIDIGSAANASLLGNFEIVATTVIALLLFKEAHVITHEHEHNHFTDTDKHSHKFTEVTAYDYCFQSKRTDRDNGYEASSGYPKYSGG